MVRIWHEIDETKGHKGDPNPGSAWCCLTQNFEDLEIMREHLGEGFEDITAASWETETGDYENIWVTWGYPSYAADNIYYPVEQKVEST